MPIPDPASNLLAMPLVRLGVDTGNNEDWVDSIKYVVDTGVPPEDMPQLDLSGIRFEMEIRRAPPNNEVVVSASTDEDGHGLAVGEPPDVGFLIIYVSVEHLKQLKAGPYVADIVGTDGAARRVVAQIDLNIVQGITR